MSIGWVAAGVRGRAMTRRRLGRGAARSLAASPSLESALAVLARSPYGHDVRTGQNLAEAQRAVVDTAVWNVRVLAGWAPREGVTMLRVLLGILEANNVDDHLRALLGAEAPPPYRLGALDTAWSRLAATTSAAEVRRVLAASAWGDPGGETPREIGLAMRTSLADRVMAAVPVAAEWAAGATALLVAREVALEHRDLPPVAQGLAARVIGPAAVAARTLPELVLALPTAARWALSEVADATDLWAAEGRWWGRVERDALTLSRNVNAGSDALIGAVAVLAVDAWRVRAALEVAARNGSRLEVFDALA